MANNHTIAFPCKKCGQQTYTIDRTEGNMYYLIEQCKACGHEDVVYECDERESTKPFTPPEQPFFNESSPIKNLKGLFEIAKDVYLHPNEPVDINEVIQLTLPQMETLLNKKLAETGFIHLSFEKPKISRHIIMACSVQDNTSRDKTSSRSALKKTIKDTLFTSNWRTYGHIEYKLGYLTFKLKGSDELNDIFEIAREIAIERKSAGNRRG